MNSLSSMVIQNLPSAVNRLILICLLCWASVGASGQSSDMATKLDQYLQAHHDHGTFTGAVRIVQKGNVLYNRSFGLADYAHNRPITDTTPFRIASLTKQFTATLIMQLVEQDKLRLADTLGRYIPGWPGGNIITIRHLLTHTSGLQSKDQPLAFTPGSQFRYSNDGYVLLGQIAGQVSRKPYHQLMRDNILNPAGMTHSGVTERGKTYPGQAIGYLEYQQQTPINGGDPADAGGAGSMYSTAEDLHKWHQALQNNRLLKASSLRQMYTPVLEHYGYGWMLDSLNGELVAKHTGGIEGFRSYMLRIPARDFCLVVLANGETGEARTIDRDLLLISTGQSYQMPQFKQEITLSTTILQQYVGEYEVAPQFIFVVTEANGQLFAQVGDQPRFRLYAENERDFFMKIRSAQVSFSKDETGRVTGMVLHEGGQDMPAKRQ